MKEKPSPNQKIIWIKREQRGKVFSMTNFESICNAARHLNGNKASAFLVWTYCVHSNDGYCLEISGKLLKTAFGMSKDAYDKAIKTLVEEKFLVQKPDGYKNHYVFYEYPEEHKCGESPLLNVGKTHIKKLGIPTFKCGESPQSNRLSTIANKNTIKDHKKTTEENIDNVIVVNQSSISPEQAQQQPSNSFSEKYEDMIRKLKEEFSEEIVNEAERRALENSTPGNDKRSYAYLKKACQSIQDGDTGETIFIPNPGLEDWN